METTMVPPPAKTSLSRKLEDSLVAEIDRIEKARRTS
jgi:hypothetical protein